MRKNQIKHLFLKFIVFVGLAFLIFSCEQDNIVNETQKESILKNQKAPTIRTFSQDNIGERFNDIAQQLNIRKYLKKSKDLSYASRTSYDTLGVTIYTDEIKEVTIDDYTSYTMRMATPETDSTSFYNVTIEDDNGVTEMYVIKYTPEETWLDNKDQPYEGNITTVRVNNFTHILPDDQGGGAGEDYGDLGYNFTEPQGSPYYPTDCNGIVYVTMESIPYQCSCEDHWPNQTCYCGINGNPGYQPGFNEVPYYYCDENSDTIDDSEQSDNTNTDTTTGGTTTTGSGNNSNPDNNLITVLLNPDEECEAPEGDLNGDCILDNYEVCLLNGYNQDVCDCVALGNQLSDCVEEDCSSSIPTDVINELNTVLGPGNFEFDCNTNPEDLVYFSNVEEANNFLEDITDNSFSNQVTTISEAGSIRRDYHSIQISSFPEAYVVTSAKIMVPEPNNPLECLQVISVNSNIDGNTTFFDWEQLDDPDPNNSSGIVVEIEESYDIIYIYIRGELSVGLNIDGYPVKAKKIKEIRLVYTYSTSEFMPGWSYMYSVN